MSDTPVEIPGQLTFDDADELTQRALLNLRAWRFIIRASHASSFHFTAVRDEAQGLVDDMTAWIAAGTHAPAAAGVAPEPQPPGPGATPDQSAPTEEHR